VGTRAAFLEQGRSDISSLTQVQGARGSVTAGHDSSYTSRFTGVWTSHGRVVSLYCHVEGLMTFGKALLPVSLCARGPSGSNAASDECPTAAGLLAPHRLSTQHP
jgi:hypothetical protein